MSQNGTLWYIFLYKAYKKMLKNVGRKEGVIMTLPKSQCFFQTWLFEYGEIFIIIENLHWSKTQIINPKSIWTNIAHLSTFNHKTADCIVINWMRSNWWYLNWNSYLNLNLTSIWNFWDHIFRNLKEWKGQKIIFRVLVSHFKNLATSILVKFCYITVHLRVLSTYEAIIAPVIPKF